MYHSILKSVVDVIEHATKPNSEQLRSDFFNHLFNPAEAQKLQQERIQKEDLRNKLIAGATAVAVVGEVILMIKRAKSLTRK